MKRVLVLAAFACVVALAVYAALTLYDETLQVGRMWETPGVKPHEDPIPVMSGMTVPFDGAEMFLRTADPDSLKPPFALNSPDTIAKGRQAYGYYCIQCHGQYHDGMGTVGQSFAPLPGDLRSAKVQQTLTPGRLFHEISYGIPGGRQPALASTLSITERWQVIGYVTTLGVRP